MIGTKKKDKSSNDGRPAFDDDVDNCDHFYYNNEDDPLLKPKNKHKSASGFGETEADKNMFI